MVFFGIGKVLDLICSIDKNIIVDKWVNNNVFFFRIVYN